MLLDIFYALKIFCLSANFRSERGPFRHPALMGNYPTLHLHILALSTKNPGHNILELHNVLL